MVHVSERVFPHPVRTEWKILARLRIDNTAITNVECAKQIGVTENTIRHWTRNPLYQSFENFLLEKTDWEVDLPTRRRHAEVREELDEFGQEMLARLKDIAETSNDQRLVAQIAFDALDRAGYEPPRTQNARPINFVLTLDAARELARRASEATDAEIVVGHLEGKTA